MIEKDYMYVFSCLLDRGVNLNIDSVVILDDGVLVILNNLPFLFNWNQLEEMLNKVAVIDEFSDKISHIASNNKI